MNHRCCRRYAVDIPITLSFQGGRKRARITNISRGGAFVNIATGGKSPVDSVAALKMDLHSSSGTNKEATLYGMVIHARENGLGIMFIDEYESFFEYLCANLPHYSTDSDLQAFASARDCLRKD